MPLVAMAVNTPWTPAGAKSWLVKFSPWNAAAKKAAMTSRMMKSFHHTRALLMRANQRTRSS